MLRKKRPPHALLYLWSIYISLARGRRYGMNGAEPIAFADIDAWCRLMRRMLTPREIEALLDVDAAFLNPDPKG